MKTDAPAPPVPPRKRRQIERVPDLWLAQWLARQDLSAGDVKRVQDEKDRRKRLRGVERRVVGFFDNPDGMTPAQRDALKSLLAETKPTKVIHPGGYRGAVARFHGICLNMKIPIEQPVSEREICKVADMVIATPKETREPARRLDKDDGVWESIRYARHRDVPMRIIMPNGAELTAEGVQ